MSELISRSPRRRWALALSTCYRLPLALIGVLALRCGSASIGLDGSGGQPNGAGAGGDSGDPPKPPFACAGETWSAAAQNQAECQAWTNCQAGQFVEVEGSTTSDRRCRPCANGTFSVELNTAACRPVSTCAAGTFLKTPASARADAV